MNDVRRRFPEDVDAQAFYALSLLAVGYPTRDTALSMRAAALLEELLPRSPRHPGVLHYMIHAYDDPVHAPLGERAARVYAEVAQDAPHALHMTSHIFRSLGEWAGVERSNAAAIDEDNRQRVAAGQPPQHCGHEPEWLVDALLQQGKITEADRRIAMCRETALLALRAARRHSVSQGEGDLPRYSNLVLMRVLETGKWGPTQRIATDALPRTSFNFAYANVFAARDDLQRLRNAGARLRQLAERAGPDPQWGELLSKMWRDRLQLILRQAAALEALRSGDVGQGVRELSEVAEAERDDGLLGVNKPTYELLGEELERLGRHAEARSAFEAALRQTPNRRRSVAGLQRSSAKATSFSSR